jgi:predicted nuclease of predicted toxin-antitoxin system
VKFLVDNQLPHALAKLLENLGHHAVHVLDIELGRVDDLTIWAYAAQNGCTIISKDADFADLALLGRTEARLIWVRIGNCRKSVLLEAFKNALKPNRNLSVSFSTLFEVKFSTVFDVFVRSMRKLTSLAE